MRLFFGISQSVSCMSTFSSCDFSVMYVARWTALIIAFSTVDRKLGKRFNAWWSRQSVRYIDTFQLTFCSLRSRLIDWLIDWFIDISIDGLIDWLIDWWINWLIDRLIDWSFDGLVDGLIDWLIRRMRNVHFFSFSSSGTDGKVGRHTRSASHNVTPATSWAFGRVGDFVCPLCPAEVRQRTFIVGLVKRSFAWLSDCDSLWMVSLLDWQVYRSLIPISLIDLFIDWLIDWLIDWSSDWPIDWLIFWMTCGFFLNVRH